MLMMLVETGHGIVREVFIAPAIGALRARQLGVLVGSVLVLLIARALARWLKADTRRAQLAIGAFWVALTLSFEFAMGRAMHLDWHRLLSDYNPAAGGFMLLGLAVMFAAPWLVSRWTTPRTRTRP
jgi:peptidoglycan/LPS O-acetylase OafA/YrhL